MRSIAVPLALLVGCGHSPSAGPLDAPATGDALTDAIPWDVAGSGGTGQWVLGYYVGYDMDALPIDSIDWNGLTHIAFAPMIVNDDLTLDTSFDAADGSAAAVQLATAAHAHGVKALLMLGGAGAGAQIATAANDANRANFVAELLAAVDSLGYDGLDLDWEDSVDLDEFVALAQDLRSARPSLVLSYPGGPINRNFPTIDPRYVTLAASLDRFNVQTYYPASAYAGAGWDSWFVSALSGASGTTPIAIDDTLQRYATAGIPAAKLGMGMAFYAICYTGGITGPRQPTDGTSQQIVGGDNNYGLGDFFAAGGTFAQSSSDERVVDATASEPYLTFVDPVDDAHCNAGTQYISYEDEASIAAKGAFSKTHGYGGIIIWQLEEGWLPSGAAGGRAPNALFEALHDAFLAP